MPGFLLKIACKALSYDFFCKVRTAVIEYITEKELKNRQIQKLSDFCGQTVNFKEVNFMYNATKYLRLSYTSDRANESDSIANQRKYIDEFVKRNPDIKIVNEQVDDGYSGIVFDRPAFKAMIEDIKSGKINCVIVKDLSRLGREYNETFTYLRRIFSALGVRFIAINDNIDTAKEAVTGDISVSFKGVMNDEYCRDISVKVRTALNIKRKNGDYVGAVPVYGYKKAADNKNQLVVDEYAARVVKDIFKMRTDGYSADRIANELNRLAVLSPREYKKDNNIPLPRNGYCDKENSKWSATTVIRILKDEIYTGKLIQGKYGKPNYKVKEYVKRNADEVFVTENAHEAIISKQDFELVQRLMRLDTRISPKKNALHLFSRILICGCCGNRMTRKTVTHNGEKYFYYYCPTGKKNGCLGGNMIKETDLVNCVTGSIKGHIKNIASLDDLISGINSNAISRDMCNKISVQITEVKKQLDKTSEYKSTLYENYISGILSKEDYKALNSSYTQEKKSLEKALKQLETELDEYKNNTSKKLQWIERFKAFENIDEIDRNVVIQLIECIHIYDKTHLQITFNFKDEYEQALITLSEYKEVI